MTSSSTTAGARCRIALSDPSRPLPRGTYRVRLQTESTTGPNPIQLMWSYYPKPVPENLLFADAGKTIQGLTGSYVNQSLRSVTSTADWRNNPTVQIAGTRVDPSLNFVWAGFGDAEGVGLTQSHSGNWENFSVQWDGFISVPYDGYRLYTKSDDNSRLWIDVNRNGNFENTATELVNNNWGNGNGQSVTLSSGSIALNAGTYPIRIQYEEEGGSNSFQLMWDYAVMPETAVTVTGVTSNTEMRPTIAWTETETAVKYEVWINNLTTRASGVVHTTVYDPWITPDFDLGIGRYAVWVRSIDARGKVSGWSQSYLFRIEQAVQLNTVPQSFATTSPTISWQPVEGAVRYQVWVNDVTTRLDNVAPESNVTATSWQISPALTEGHEYRVWVRGIDAAGRPSQWSAMKSFRILGETTPTTPLGGTFDYYPTLKWTAAPGARRYHVVLRDENGDILESAIVAGTQWTSPTGDWTGQWNWQVTPEAWDFQFGTPSEIITFNLGGVPQAMTPIGSGASSLPLFNWNAVVNADTYLVWVDRLDIPQREVINSSSLTTTSYSPTTPLAPGTYRYWILATSNFYGRGAWSAPVEFIVS
ncbi:MAG: PA14 domain-containing protein [Planctomycetaceae bacterium]